MLGKAIIRTRSSTEWTGWRDVPRDSKSMQDATLPSHHRTVIRDDLSAGLWSGAWQPERGQKAEPQRIEPQAPAPREQAGPRQAPREERPSVKEERSPSKEPRPSVREERQQERQEERQRDRRPESRSDDEPGRDRK